MTPSALHTISRKAAQYLNHRGYALIRSVSLRERDAPETFVCTRFTGEILHVKLKICPNTLSTIAEVARYCEDEIRVLRKQMKNNPPKPGEHYEILVTTLGKHFAVEVQPDQLMDNRTGAVLIQCPLGGVWA
ncbi:MAG: hypothetical protein WC593_00530 [Methanoregula sp.]